MADAHRRRVVMDRLDEGKPCLSTPSRRIYHRAVADVNVDANQDLPPLTFKDQVAFWLEVWTVDRPELREQARAVADPDDDPWGYLATLGELILTAD